MAGFSNDKLREYFNDYCIRCTDSSLRQTLGEPDQFKFKYRDELRTVIGLIIRDGMELENAKLYIKAFTANLPAADRERKKKPSMY